MPSDSAREEALHMAPRDDEEHARVSFDRYIREHGVSGTEWQPFPRGESKPPDFNLRVSEIAYAVEVTSLLTQYEQDDGSTIAEQSIWKATERLTDDVEREAAAKGILRGGYVLTVEGPFGN